ncbi:hypothetical protein Tco_1288559 [Tanacetum coccineum]
MVRPREEGLFNLKTLIKESQVYHLLEPLSIPGAGEDVFPSEFDVIVGKGFHFINNNKNVLQVLIMSLIIDGEEVDAATKGKEVSKVNATELSRMVILRINEESNGEGSSGSDKCNAINIDDDNKEEAGANRGKTGVLQDNVVKE